MHVCKKAAATKWRRPGKGQRQQEQQWQTDGALNFLINLYFFLGTVFDNSLIIMDLAVDVQEHVLLLLYLHTGLKLI